MYWIGGGGGARYVRREEEEGRVRYEAMMEIRKRCDDVLKRRVAQSATCFHDRSREMMPDIYIYIELYI